MTTVGRVPPVNAPGPSPADRTRLRLQLVVTPLIGGTVGIAVGVLLLVRGAEAPVPWWPFLLSGVALVGYALRVGRRLAAPPGG